VRLDAARPVHFCDGLRRRDFLHAGALGFLGLSLGDVFARRAEGAVADRDISCIALMLVGAPSHLDTWDMKPDAPSGIRGPFRPIPTNVPGVQISEIFPRMARLADKYALLRSVHYEGVAVHDAGHQVLQTGRLFEPGLEHPHVGCVVGYAKGPNRGMPPHVVLPGPIGHTGGNMPHGQGAGFLGRAFDPLVLNADVSRDADRRGRVHSQHGADPPTPAAHPAASFLPAVYADQPRNLRDLVDRSVRAYESSPEVHLLDSSTHRAYSLLSSSKARAAFDLSLEPDAVKDRYGRNRFGLSCLLARRLIEADVRFVTVNMFDTVFNETTWDIHGSAPFSPIEAYKTVLGPMFDNAYSSLLEDLESRGRLSTTLVVGMGEFGRTPKINAAGGRDHWPQCWTISMAGGGVKGGQVIGASDDIGAYPTDRPIPAAAVAATMMHALGLDPRAELPGPGNRPIRIVEHGVEPVMELF
jgi:hypothetical protein